MKKLAALAAIAAMFSASAAFADTMQNADGNTITITYPSGAVVRYHFNADQTFSQFTPDGQVVTGTYAIEGDQICLTPTGHERACTEYVGGKNVGDTWTQQAINGETITVTLQPGR